MSLLVTTGLTKSFHEGTKRVQAVNGVSLTLERGEILAFLGPNGAGKTTTIKMIPGLSSLMPAKSRSQERVSPGTVPRTSMSVQSSTATCTAT